MTSSCFQHLAPCLRDILGVTRTVAPVSQAPDRVATMAEAMSINRSREGHWTPSPFASPSAAKQDPSLLWSSPVPRRRRLLPGTAPAPPSEEMELVLADMDTDGAPWQSTEAAPPSSLARFALEQLIQSPAATLPEPMHQESREEVIRLCSPTATGEMMTKMPRHLLEQAGEEAQTLRRKLLRGATVVFVTAGYAGKRFIYERAAELGVKSVILDHPDSWSKGLVDEGLVAKFLPVDMSQSSEDVYQEAKRLIGQLKDDPNTGAVEGILTFVELSVPLASRLGEAFGLPGFRPASVDDARDKHKTRDVMAAAGLPTPRNMLIHNEEELARAAEVVGFPAVLKPTSGAASLGCRKVESAEGLRSCFREVVKELSSLVVSSGALQTDDGSGGVVADKVIDLTLLMEQYLDGREVDVDIVMSDGQWQFASVTDNGPTMEPYFPETWALCPSLLPKDEQAALKELAVNAVRALGFTSGVFHVEGKMTSTGPQLIEVNTRMGGGPVWELNRRTWGVDLIEEALFCTLGIPARPAVPAAPKAAIAYYFVNARRSGVIRNISCVEKLRVHDDVLFADAFVHAGDRVVGPEEGMPTWMCQIVVVRETSKMALERVLDYEATMQAGVEYEE